MAEMKTQKIIFDAMELGVCLSIQEMVKQTGIYRKTVCEACCALVTNGYLQRRERGCYELTAEGIAVKEGREDLKSKCETRKPTKYPKTLRVRLWRAIRQLKKFRVSELLELAEDGSSKNSYSNAKMYVSLLCRHGILVEMLRRGESKDGHKNNGEKRYALMEDVGHSAPVFRRNGDLFDPNKNEVCSCQNG